ncbi:hypothetical protein [Micromonospora sp. NPDC048830]|uniref:hypothetical protein n=1 Tax=Micromonospora sp. NPDC048830 TaxID=3364257 RepID=UPI00371607D0
MRRLPLLALLLALPLLAPPTGAHAAAPAPATSAVPATSAPSAAALAATGPAGTTWTVEPATGRTTVTVDDTVSGSQLAALRAKLAGTDAVIRPGGWSWRWRWRCWPCWRPAG